LVDMDGDEIIKGIYAMRYKKERRLLMSGDVAARSQSYLQIKKKEKNDSKDRSNILKYRPRT